MLSAINSCSLGQSGTRLLLDTTVRVPSMLVVSQRGFAIHRPIFNEAEEERYNSARGRLTRKFEESDRGEYNSRPLRGREYQDLGYPGRNRYNQDRGQGYQRREFGEEIPQDRFKELFASLESRTKELDPNFQFVKFPHQPSSVPIDEVKAFLKTHGIRFHKEIPAGFAPVKTFDETPFHPRVKELFLKKGFSSPTPAQSMGWPLVLQNKDVIGIAETGSGKTLSFMLPLAEHVALQGKKVRSAIPRPKGLIVAPTRELAQQILTDSRPFLDVYGFAGSAVYGGSAKFSQVRDLQMRNDFVVGTPGRLMDLVQGRELSLDSVSYTVFDEADRMLDMGFEPQIRRILDCVPTNRLTMMWSATWPKAVQHLAHDFLQKDSVRFTVGNDQLTANRNIQQKFIFTTRAEATSKLITLISQLEPSANSKVLIFCSTKRSCDQLQWTLERERIDAEVIHGDKQQATRDRSLRSFKSGYTPILIATDVASRGLDVKDIQTVINFELPNDEESYVHRIGRTARGGNTGTAISFFTPEDADLAQGLKAILQEAGQEVPPSLLSVTYRRDDGDRRYGGRGGSGGGGGGGGRGGRGSGSGFNQTTRQYRKW